MPLPNPPEKEPVTVTIDQPADKGQVVVNVPFQVQGSVDSSTKITGVGLNVDGVSTPVIDDSRDWSSWHAEVTLKTAGPHTLGASAVNVLKVTGKALAHVTAVLDTPTLSCVSPPSPGNLITMPSLSFNLVIQAQTILNDVAWVKYQLAAGPWTDLTLSSGSQNWQGTITLPGGHVPRGGVHYALAVQAQSRMGLTSTLSLSVLVMDSTPPILVSFDPPDGQMLQPGVSPVVTVVASDQPAGRVASGVASVTVQVDNQSPQPATQSSSGDPSKWSATLAPPTRDFHTLTVVVIDVQGNATTVAHRVGIALTSWTRVEPISRDPSLKEGLQARVADPLWLLTRQAAFGEFVGIDSGSPVSVRLRAKASGFTRLRGSSQRPAGPGELLPADGGPLETLTEAEPEPAVATGPGQLIAAQAGLHYLRLLQAATGVGNLTVYRQGLLNTYALPDSSDPAMRPYTGHVPDGARLYADLIKTLRPPGNGQLPAAPALGGANASVVASVAWQWLAWYDAVTGRALGNRDYWRPDRMEYAFNIAAPGPDGETVLAAAECDTGELDWFDFDLVASHVQPATAGNSLAAVPGDMLGAPASGNPHGRFHNPGGDSIVFVALPTPVSFRGMPNRRWWDFEDAVIDFGAITAPIEDVTTSLMVEFALRFGNDHFIIPLPLAVGSVCRVTSLVVTNTFGELLSIRPVSTVDTANGPFRLFEHTLLAPDGSRASTRDPLFVLFPTLGEVQGGSPIEEVHFVRDEAAEIVWAIEQTALGSTGVPVDRTQEAAAHFVPLPATPNDGSSLPVRHYVLRTDVEENWFPFLLPDDTTGTMLTLANVPSLAGKTMLPLGRILSDFAPSGKAAAGMPQEEVTRTGLQVVRAWRYARWINGQQLSWVGRRVRPGRGPGASGVTFDLAT